MWYLIVSIPDLCTIIYFDCLILPGYFRFYPDFLKILRENEIIFLKERGGGVVVGDLSNTTSPLLIRHWTISNFMENSLGLKRVKEPGADIQLGNLSIYIWEYCSCL